MCGVWVKCKLQTRPLKTTATGECLSYHSESKRTNEYVWQQVNILARCQELLLSTTIKRCNLRLLGRVCRRNTRSKIILQGTVDGSRHRRTISRNAQASQCRHCCTSRMTEVDGQSSLTADASIRVPRRSLGVMGISFITQT